MALKTSIKGFDKLAAYLKNLPIELKRLVKDEVNTSAGVIRDKAKGKVPVDRAALKNSITVKDNGGLNYSVGSDLKQAAWVEFGTKQQVQVPKGYEEEALAARKIKSKARKGEALENITAWVRRKNITGYGKSRKKSALAALKSVSYLIYRKIMREGIKPQPYLIQHFEPERKKLLARLEKIFKSLKTNG